MVTAAFVIVRDAQNVLLGVLVIECFVERCLSLQPGRDGEGSVEGVGTNLVRRQNDGGGYAVELQNVTAVRDGPVGVHLGVTRFAGRGWLVWQQFNQGGMRTGFCRTPLPLYLQR